MSSTRDWLIAAAIVIVAVPLIGWVGAGVGRKAAKNNPSLALSLLLFASFLKVDPPPPPSAERVVKDEEVAGDPPEV